MRLSSLVLVSLVLSAPAMAQGDRTDFTCSSQLLSSVAGGMPAGLRDLDPRDLSCLGLSQVYFIQTGPSNVTDYEERQRIRAVFRREGLSR